MITVRVVDRNGNAVANADVHISWNGTWNHSNGRTNGSGEVSINASPGTGTISVNGREIREMRFSGSDTVSV